LLVHYRVLLGGLAIASYAAVTQLPPAASGPELMLVGLNAWLWLLTIVGFATRYLNRQNRWVAEFNRIVFPFYLIHQACTFVVARLLFPLAQVNPWVVYLLVCLLTSALCLLVIYGLFVRLPARLQPFVGLRAAGPAKLRLIKPVVAAESPLKAAG